MLGKELFALTSSGKKRGKKPFQDIRTVKGEENHPSTLNNIAKMIQIYIKERVDNTINRFRKSPDKN